MASDPPTLLLITFSLLLFVAVLLSGYFRTSLLSGAAIFLVAGVILGDAGIGTLQQPIDSPLTTGLVEVTLFVVLFVDGMEVDVHALRGDLALPARALLIGLPLTFAFLAAGAVALLGVGWAAALLLAIALAPTDPVFASGIVREADVPISLRRLLNLESGMNDGLVLPVLVVVLNYQKHTALDIPLVALEVALGIALGIAVPWLAVRLERTRAFRASSRYQLIQGGAIALLIYALARWTHGNEFLAAFAGGAMVSWLAPPRRHDLSEIGEVMSELLKLLTVFLFSLAISRHFLLEQIRWQELAFVVFALAIARPVALVLALMRGRLTTPALAAAMWFGPRGLASMLYGLVILQQGTGDASYVFHVVALVTATSILLHSSTDTLLVRRAFSPRDRTANAASRSAR